MQTAMLEEQIVHKIGLLDPIQKQTVYSFIDFLLREQPTKPATVQQSSLLQVSVWEEEALASSSLKFRHKQVGEYLAVA